jgi:hypothetical protein
MSLRSRFLLPAIALLNLGFLAACGGSSTHLPVPPPSGGFSNSDLSGSYTFSVSGEDLDSTTGEPSPFAMAGTFTACGCTAGTISAGTVDLSDISSTGSALTVSSGTYTVGTDGRGTAALSIAIASGTTYPLTLDFALTSNSHGLIIRFDQNGTGSGSIDLQPATVAQSAVENVPYAFSLSGSYPSESPLLTSGAFTLDSSGNITTTGATAGIEDFTYKIPPATAAPALALSGSLSVGSGTAPGTATLNTSFGTLRFDVYAVDATHLKLIESDGQYVLVGDVFSQPSAAIPSGNLVFTMAGLDASDAPFGAGGIVSSNGTSTLTSGSEDVNDAGTVDGGTSPATPASFAGAFAATPTGSGRFVVTFTGFVGGTTFAAYPSSGGILMQEIDTTGNAGITGGVMMAQSSGAALAASQGYGMNLTGTDLTADAEFDAIAQFNTTSSGMTGLIDLNDFGSSSPTSTTNFAGSYTPGNNGTGSATFTSGPLGGVLYYAADSSTVLLLSTDSTDVAVGAFQEQSTPGTQAAVAQRNLAMIKAVHAGKRPGIK